MLTKKQLKRLETVTQIDAIPGHEQQLARYLEQQLTKMGYKMVRDNLGSIFGLKKSHHKDAPRVIVGAHMDEVGFTVSQIKDNGLISVSARGGIDPLTVLAKRVRLTVNEGKTINGSVDALPPHLSNEANNKLKISDLSFDFGFINKQAAIDAGVLVGAMIVVDGPFVVLDQGQRLLSKAFDNRYGVFMALEIAEYFQNKKLDIDLYIGATVQEEVGLRGAQTISHVIKPDFAIVLDCSPARDTFGKDQEGALGGGVLLRYFDRSMLGFRELIAFQEKIADKLKVKSQYYSSPGGTDAGAFHLAQAGVLTLTHCICARNIHTCSSVIDTDDVLGAKKVLIAILKALDQPLIEKFKMERR